MTTTLKPQVALLFLASAAVYVTVVVPIGKQKSPVCVPDTEGVPQLSVAVGAVKLTATHKPFADAPVLLVGQVVPKLGGVTSFAQALTNVTVKLHVLVKPLLSVAV